ncbi:hypothetical protein DFH09DRAFT_1080489 [Mycena vulgaris]|nr:hypothetical protein DFH09DRAFT_1080489 [Mycena vulgaris]
MSPRPSQNMLRSFRCTSTNPKLVVFPKIVSSLAHDWAVVSAQSKSSATGLMRFPILLFAPLPLFRSLLDKSLSHKLALIFSTCVVTTIVLLVHATFILRDYDFKILISGIVEGCLSLIVANIPVIITSTIDIVGEQDHVRTAQFSTIFWFSEARTTEAMDLNIIGEVPPDGAKSSYATTEDMSSWDQNGLTASKRTVVSSIKPVVVSLDPISPV